MSTKNNICETIPQECQYIENGLAKKIRLPPPSECVMRGIKWGRYDRTFTPAFWKAQTLIRPHESIEYKWGSCLKDEIVACILGGYGVTAEMSAAAFKALKEQDALDTTGKTDAQIYQQIIKILSSKLNVGGHNIHYRFAKQRAKRIFLALLKLKAEIPPESDLKFRAWVKSFNGIGAKTASWITRNWLGSDNVAIIDIHIFRACTIMGLFNGNENPTREYEKLEKKLVALAKAMHVKLSEMDVIMWDQMRTMKDYAILSFNDVVAHRHLC